MQANNNISCFLEEGVSVALGSWDRKLYRKRLLKGISYYETGQLQMGLF